MGWYKWYECTGTVCKSQSSTSTYNIPVQWEGQYCHGPGSRSAVMINGPDQRYGTFRLLKKFNRIRIGLSISLFDPCTEINKITFCFAFYVSYLSTAVWITTKSIQLFKAIRIFLGLLKINTNKCGAVFASLTSVQCPGNEVSTAYW